MRLAPEIQDSLELRFSNLARTKNAKGEKIISFGLGEPGFPTPPEVVEAACQAMRAGMTRYSNPFGLPDLRERIAEKLARENGIAAKPGRIIVAPGAKMALSLALTALLEPGDEVINVTPCYPSFLPQILLAEPGAIAHNVDLRKQDFGLDLEALAAHMNERTRALLINFPHNPTGRMLSESDAQGLAELLERHPRCFLVSDEIYERLNHGGTPHRSLAAHPGLAGRVVVINGFSKAFSMTGWRIGYAVLPDESLLKKASLVQQHLNTNTATFIQKAALATFDLPADFLDGYNANLRANAQALREVADASPNLSLVPSEGGLFAFLNISGSGLDSDAFASGFLERHDVAATPGIVFGPAWDDHLRVSLATGHEEFKEGTRRLARFAGEIAHG